MKQNCIFKSIICIIFAFALLFPLLADMVYAEGIQNPDLLGIELLGLDKASSRFAEAEGTVKVAVIDSGIDKNHSWFENRLDLEHSVNLADDKEADDFSDDSGHGTHVAGIIAKGTPSQVKIVAIRILQTGANGEDAASVFTLMDAINYAVSCGCDVINLSLGYNTEQLKKDLGGSFEKIDSVLRNASDKGCILTVAAGNSAEEIANNYLAYSPYTICVGGLEDDMYTGTFHPLKGENYGDGMEFAAPGYYIESAAPGNKTVLKTGTSMACPHISCAAAILKLAHPEHNPETVRKTFRSYAVDMEESGWDALTGYGYPDLSSYDGSEVLSENPGDEGESEGGEQPGGNHSKENENEKETTPGVPEKHQSEQKERIPQKNHLKKPAKVVLKKLRAGKGRILVSWKKQESVQGYQIRYQYKKQKKYRSITIKKGTATKKYLKNLKRNKRYFVQVRAFRKRGDIVKYGAWSRRLAARVK